MNRFNTKSLVVGQNDTQLIVKHVGLNTLMDILINRLLKAIENYDSSLTFIPVRKGFNYTYPEIGLIEWMPIYTEGNQVVIKLVGYHPSNPAKYGLPTILSNIASYDTLTGHLIGMIDGVLPTALRTGAASALASQLMAYSESSILGIIGCGAQAVTQVHALSRIFDFEEILIYDVDERAIRSFENRCCPFDLKANFKAAGIQELVESSDILVTATSIEINEGPLFSNISTQSHLHVNAIGSDFPGKVELPIDLLNKSFVCPDFKEQAKLEGECQQLEESQIGADLVNLIKHSEHYTYLHNNRTVFDSTGWALQDQVIMELFMEYAIDLGIGQEIELENNFKDAKSPYSFLMEVASTLNL